MQAHKSTVLKLTFAVFNAVILTTVMYGQQASPSMVTDWTHRHLIFSSPGDGLLPDYLQRDPRYWQQWLRRNPELSAAIDGSSLEFSHDVPIRPLHRSSRRFKRDWAQSLGPGATVGAGHYPAKYSFSITTANCGTAPHPDYVAFNTSVTPSSTQASIVAFDNIYSGCGGTVPSTYWAYNTGGTVQTSSVLSLDGNQLAFVQSVSSKAQLVLLKWQASTTATSTNPGPINVVTTSQYATCTLPCMTTIPFSGGANDTNSSPFEDYSDDTIYVGDDNGLLHKFTPIFTGGTPAEVTTNWPVTLASGLKLSSPVYDHATGRVFVGSGYTVSGSQLFAVTGSSGAVAGTSSSLGKGVGISAEPIVDSSAGKVFVFLGNDGGTGCAGPCMAVYQFATNFTSGTGTKATVGNGGSLPLYNGDFDNAYLTSANATGNLFVCGGSSFGSSEPSIYRVPITAGVMSSSSIQGPALGTSNVACSPVSDIYTPSTGVDRMYAGVTSGGDEAACSGVGCVVNLMSNTWQKSTSYSPGQVILDPLNNMQVASGTTTGTSGTTTPFWNETCGNQTSDGTVTWTDAGFLSPVTPTAWQKSAFWSVGFRILDSNLNYECALETGIASGTTAPTWKTTIGLITTEATGLQWRNAGPMTSHALGATGGTSGIIMDNIVGSGTLVGASQIYFSILSTGECGAGNGCAIQASQSTLN